MTKGQDGIYTAAIADNSTQVIFVRMNPATTAPIETTPVETTSSCRDNKAC